MPKGMIISILAVALWALFDVLSRYLALQFSVDPLLFIITASLCAGLTLLVTSGPGPLGKEVVKNPYTWSYSFFEIMENVFGLYAFMLITATEANFLIRLSLLVGLFMVWFALGRKPNNKIIIPVILIISGCLLIVGNIDPQVRYLVLLFIAISVFFRAFSAIISELHPQNRPLSVKERCRMTGYILTITSLIFILVTFFLSSIKSLIVGGVDDQKAYEFIVLLPDLANFWHIPTIWSGLFMGTLIMSVYTYLYFSAARTIKSETFLAIAAFSPVLTFIFEFIGSYFGFLDIQKLEIVTFWGGALITFGAIFYIYFCRQKN